MQFNVFSNCVEFRNSTPFWIVSNWHQKASAQFNAYIPPIKIFSAGKVLTDSFKKPVLCQKKKQNGYHMLLEWLLVYTFSHSQKNNFGSKNQENTSHSTSQHFSSTKNFYGGYTCIELSWAQFNAIQRLLTSIWRNSKRRRIAEFDAIRKRIELRWIHWIQHWRRWIA